MSKSLKLTTLPKSTLSKNISEEKFDLCKIVNLSNLDIFKPVFYIFL